jgi:hypothetical protein
MAMPGPFPEAVIRKFRITAADGKNCDTQHSSLTTKANSIPRQLFGIIE